MLRYVNDKGKVVERFLAIYKVEDTTSKALKEALYDILGRQKLSISKIRGQGYDGASNMRGASCKRRDALREAQHKDILKRLESDVVLRVRGTSCG
ncbi:hypothetical protein P8452_45256 [Trifolium repens]|nr:hypothetical protein P8452_45256 [Trifolium repens]